MIVAIVALDLIAIAAFYAFHINRDFDGTRNTFVGVWMLVSFVVVAIQLRKIRRARLEIIRGQTPGSGPGAPPTT
jgi:hypothetical protein